MELDPHARLRHDFTLEDLVYEAIGLSEDSFLAARAGKTVIAEELRSQGKDLFNHIRQTETELGITFPYRNIPTES